MRMIKQIGRFAAFIEHDALADDPRKDFDNASTMICFSSRWGRDPHYSEHGAADSGGWVRMPKTDDHYHAAESRDGFELWAKMRGVVYAQVSRPEYKAYFYMTKETILKEYGGKIVTATKRAKAQKLVEVEAKTYRQWADGEVYASVIYEIDADDLEDAEDDESVFSERGEVVESCGGFYGEEYCEEEALSMLAHVVAEAAKKEAEAVRIQAEADAFAANYGMV